MLRVMIAVFLTIITLDLFSYDVRFKDGLHLHGVGWPEHLSTWWKGGKTK